MLTRETVILVSPPLSSCTSTVTVTLKTCPVATCLDRNVRERGVLAQEAPQDVGARAAGASDEDELRIVSVP